MTDPRHERLHAVLKTLPSYVAITLSRHVLTRATSLDECILRHEWVHMEHWRRYGLFGFLGRYLWYHFRVGYEANPFEIEAREAEKSLPGQRPTRDR